MLLTAPYRATPNKWHFLYFCTKIAIMKSIDLSVIKKAKYIKLGKGGGWDALCLQDGTIRLGYYRVPHDICVSNDVDAIKRVCEGANKQTTSNHARQVLDFYNAGPETLWITFANGVLYWAQAHNKVEYLGDNDKEYPNGSRLKHTLHGWSKCSLSGNILRLSELSGKLTRSASYRQTICEIKGDAFEYLLRKLSDQNIPAVSRIRSNIADLTNNVEQLIQLLTWQDFELFIDLMLSSSGWQRVSLVGGVEKSTDIEYVLPITNERVFVQVKSRTDQAEFDEYVRKFEAMTADKFFYIYHSSPSQIKTENCNIKLLGVKELAEVCFKEGFVDWLCSKV